LRRTSQLTCRERVKKAIHAYAQSTNRPLIAIRSYLTINECIALVKLGLHRKKTVFPWKRALQTGRAIKTNMRRTVLLGRREALSLTA